MKQLRHSHWALRLAAFAAAFVIEATVATFYVVPAALSFIDGRIPGVSFYHLAPGEAPGPLGDVSEAFWCMGIEAALFIVILIPVALYLRARWLVVAAAVLYLPLQLFSLLLVQALSRSA